MHQTCLFPKLNIKSTSAALKGIFNYGNNNVCHFLKNLTAELRGFAPHFVSLVIYAKRPKLLALGTEIWTCLTDFFPSTSNSLEETWTTVFAHHKIRQELRAKSSLLFS